ncbi:hypothetical protein BGZ63DRAFT_419243 [Mariannaea sp. PMI_226]|nr:hypothetical protein BGZ63DRAFT_419243 [Mariannaea sp. PMI_226]
MTGLSFRRLLSPTRTKSRDHDIDCSGDWDTDGSCSATKAVRKHKRSRSWIPTTRKKRSPSTESIEARGIRSNHRVNISLPQTSFGQAFSSTCDLLPSQEAQKLGFAGTSSDMKASSSLCLPGQIQGRRCSIPPVRPPRPSIGLDSILNWDPSFSEIRPTPPLSLSTPPGTSHSDNQSTSSLTAFNKETSTNSVTILDPPVLRIEDACLAAGTDLKNVSPCPQPIQEAIRATSPAPLLTSQRRIAPKPLPLRLNKQTKSRDIPSPLASPARTASVMKPKRKKSNKRPMFYGTHPRRAQMRGLRSWALPENLTEILTGQRFKRIEADEMLTPERLEQLMRRREQARQEEWAQENMQDKEDVESCDSNRKSLSESSEVQLAPFHMEDLPLLIEVSDAEMDMILEEEPNCSSLNEDIMCQDFKLERNSSADEIYLKPLTYQVEDVMDNTEAPTTPVPTSLDKTAVRFSIPPVQKPLPPIPEVSVATPKHDKSNKVAKQRKRARRPLRLAPAEEKNGILYLPGTPFTLTNPMFRQGSIMISKADICQNVKAMDDTLDWTAFQMAILCGAGDLFPDLTWEEDRKQVDDITAWFDSFGFKSCGTLLSEDVPVLSSSESTRSTISVSPSTVDMDSELPIPVDSEYPSGFWNSSSPSSLGLREKFFHSKGLRRWTGEGHPKPYMNRNSIDSGPPSPMLPLIISPGSADGDDPVPMGYNLNHDLGEFLRWEAENVYATGYCVSP